MNSLAEHVENAIRTADLIKPGEQLLVAVSGGLDSMVLLRVLSSLAPAQDWTLTVAHFNHLLRGRESERDEALVRRTTKALGLRFRAGRGDVTQLARVEGITIEMAARQLRHRFFARVAATLGICKIALAHHADDQIELFFLRLLRGTGPEGLVGMKALSPSPINSNLQLIRPLLRVSRTELEAFAVQHKVPFRRDRSNDDLRYERNRIRHKLLPFLRETFQPALNEVVLRCMQILGDEMDALSQWPNRAGRTQRFGLLPVALQRRRLRSDCLRLGFTPDFQLIEYLRKNADQERMVAPETILWRDSAGVVHKRWTSKRDFNRQRPIIAVLGAGGHVRFGAMRVSWKLLSWTKGAPLGQPSGSREYFDADKVGPGVCLRHWLPGDRFQPIGMRQAVKVQDLFTNLKVPRELRSRLVVAATEAGDIFWVESLRISDRYKIDDTTRRCLEWCWERSPEAVSIHSTRRVKGP